MATSEDLSKLNKQENSLPVEEEKPEENEKDMLSEEVNEARNKIDEHRTIIDNEGITRTCEGCEKVLLYKALLNAHEMSYTGARPFYCITCGDVSENRPSVSPQDVNIEEEVKEKIKGDKSVYLPEDVSNTYNCAECGNISQDTKYLTSHMKTFHTNQLASCPDCSFNFKNPTYLGQHLLQTLNMDTKSIIEKLVNGIDTKSEI